MNTMTEERKYSQKEMSRLGAAAIRDVCQGLLRAITNKQQVEGKYSNPDTQEVIDAINDLRADRDRWVKRMKELEARIENAQRNLSGHQ